MHYYQGTTHIEFEHTLRTLFNLKNTDSIIFLDEDGVPIVFSQSLPQELQLSIQVKANAKKDEEIKLNEE